MPFNLACRLTPHLCSVASFRIAAALPPLVPLRQTKDSIALKETAATNAFTDTVAVPEIVAFVSVGNLETARYRHTATLLRDGRVLVAGGRSLDHHVLSSTEVFSPTAGKWNSSRAISVRVVKGTPQPCCRMVGY